MTIAELIKCKSCGFEFDIDEPICGKCHTHICPQCKKCNCPLLSDTFPNGILRMSF